MNQVRFRQLWRRFAELIGENKSLLNDLDAAIGDADHGSNMDRGLHKAVEALVASAEGSLRADAKLVGMTMLSTVGGASGALWGSGLLKFSAALPEVTAVSWVDFVEALGSFVDALAQRGKAVAGDKTMMDVFIPALVALRAHPEEPPVRIAAEVAESARAWSEATREMEAKRGRAAYLGPRSVGHVDPGSVSTALWFQSLAEVLADEEVTAS